MRQMMYTVVCYVLMNCLGKQSLSVNEWRVTVNVISLWPLNICRRLTISKFHFLLSIRPISSLSDVL